MRRLARIVPYVIVLALALYLYSVANQLSFVAPGGRIGPDVWPKAILVLAMLTCGYEICRRLIRGKLDSELDGSESFAISDGGIDEELPPQSLVAPPTVKSHQHLLAIGVALSIAYVALLETLGFFLATWFFLFGFMVAGGFRRYVSALAISVMGSALFVLIFMKIVYVSLPQGREPFMYVSHFLMRIMGIR